MVRCRKGEERKVGKCLEGGILFFIKVRWDLGDYNKKKESIAITQPDTGFWQDAIEVLDLSLKSDVSDKYQQRFFFVWTSLSLRYGKQLRMKSPAHPKKREQKDPLSKKVRKD